MNDRPEFWPHYLREHSRPETMSFGRTPGPGIKPNGKETKAEASKVVLEMTFDPGGSKSWVYRYTRSKKTRYLGLGSVRGLGLAAARSAAAKARHDLEQGKDPIEARKAAEADAKLAGVRVMKFKECAEALIDSHEASWKNQSIVSSGAIP